MTLIGREQLADVCGGFAWRGQRESINVEDLRPAAVAARQNEQFLRGYAVPTQSQVAPESRSR